MTILSKTQLNKWPYSSFKVYVISYQNLADKNVINFSENVFNLNHDLKGKT